jgi:hypothetical protein
MLRNFSFRVISFAFAFFLSSAPAWAWGSPGHMAVASVAWEKLDATHQARVQQLLKHNPYYSKWTGYVSQIKNLTSAQKEAALFMYAATWPDEIKEDPAYKGTDTAPAGTSSPETKVGYTDMLKHKYWHFVDTPFKVDGSSAGTTPAPNAATQITYFSSALKTTSDDKQESYYLVWLEHLVGDIHQPLHAATRFVNGTSDIGGNKVNLTGKPSELHAYWDELPGTTDLKNPVADYTSAMTFVAKLKAAAPAAVSVIDVQAWVTESFTMAKKDAYVSPIGPGLGPYGITSGSMYANDASKDALLRVELAGERLAKLITDNLK